MSTSPQKQVEQIPLNKPELFNVREVLVRLSLETYENAAQVAQESNRSVESVIRAAIGIYLVNRQYAQEQAQAETAVLKKEASVELAPTSNDSEPLDLW